MTLTAAFRRSKHPQLRQVGNSKIGERYEEQREQLSSSSYLAVAVDAMILVKGAHRQGSVCSRTLCRREPSNLAPTSYHSALNCENNIQRLHKHEYC